MKYSAALIAAIAGTVIADSTQTAKDISEQAKKISSAIDSFDQAVKGYSGGDAGKLTSASNAIGAATKEASSALGGASPLTLTDALGIQATFNTLQTTIDGAMTDLTGIKSKLVSSGQGCEVQKQLNDQEGNANELAKLIVSKVPTEVKTVAETLAGNVGAAITKAKGAFADACTGGSSSSGSSSSGSASTGSSSSGSASGSSGSSSSSGHGASGHGASGTTSGSTTSTAPKPAVYTGAASAVAVPVLGAFALVLASFGL